MQASRSAALIMGSSERATAAVQVRNSGESSAGMPSISQNTATGSG